MANQWGISREVELKVTQRDKYCVYCGVEFLSDGTRKTQASWEHIVNDIRLNSIENIALSCVSCNASKGNKELSVWLLSEYCKSKNICKDSVADVVKEIIHKGNQLFV
ncbi:MAG TPA: HNH endonuclease signature motif containing protein [Taishania sp.]|nr:HNH endonuclease signature motif containing protein [Taishania sp.]